MKNNRMTIWGRMLTILGGIMLFAVLFVPMWQIQLAAPQYPEGLVLLIFPNNIGGNVDIINGLNHYIGMKTIHTADFFEFTVLPYIIGFFGVVLLITGITGKRWLLNTSFILFVCFGVVAMIDFWKWEYNYGHNLNPDAAIIVPGMAYQPPLIGFKQLLNFGAYSIPDIGGWLFVGVGLILGVLVIAEFKINKKKIRLNNPLTSLMAALILAFASSCNTKPEPIIAGRDHCDFCKMMVSDNRFSAEIITTKGKIYKFDDGHCIIAFLQSGNLNHAQVKEIYFTDFSNDHSFIYANDVVFLKSDELRSPMGGNFAAFNNIENLQSASEKFKGKIVHWTDLYKP